MKLESEVQQDIQIQGMHHQCNLMRNNSGCLPNENGTPVRYGLGNISKEHVERIKSADLIGITKIKITHDMVGKTIGVFTAIECKKEGWNEHKKMDKREQAQLNFINFVKSCGGFAGFCSDVKQLLELLK